MKILTISHMFPNNVNSQNGIFLKEYVNSLAPYCEMEIMAPVPRFPLLHLTTKYKDIDKVNDSETKGKLKIYHPRYFMVPKYFKSLDGMFYKNSLNDFVEGLFTKNQFNILHFHWLYPDAYAGIQWALKYNLRSVATIHGNESIYFYGTSRQKNKIKEILNKLDHIVTVTNDLKNRVINGFGIPESKVSVIGNAANSKNFYYIEKEIAKEKLGLDNKQKYILSLCRLSKEKGLANLLKAFCRYSKDKTEIIFIGDGPERNNLEKEAKSLGIDNKVRFHGSKPQEELVFWYNACDIYCLPSLWEGCPNTILESLACGTPVVSTMVGGIPDMVTKDNGILVPAGNVDELAKALEISLGRKWDREAISREGCKNTWDIVARKYMEIYRKVLS